jgi:hypothetical protein
MRCLPLLLLLLVLFPIGCSEPALENAGQSKEPPQPAAPEHRGKPERWAKGDCSDDGGSIRFYPNGTWQEKHRASGRWFRREGALHIELTSPAMSVFTTSPLVDMIDDEDGRLLFLAPDIIEARAGAMSLQIRRCD